MNFTDAQKTCINERNCSLLISAGAGSGKTAVLTTRIAERLTDPNDDCEIDDFLVVTFTKAAAGELRERLFLALNKAVSENPQNKKAIRQLAKITLSKISTIHSFCFDLISKNFNTLNLSPNIRISDAYEDNIIKERILEEILNNIFEEESDNLFLNAVDAFSGAKSDKNFSETILSLYKKMQNFPDPFSWFDFALGKYEEVLKHSEFFDCEFGKIAKSELEKALILAINTLNTIIYECLQYPQLQEKYTPAFKQDLASYENLLSNINSSYINVASILQTLSKTAVGRISKFEYPDFAKSIRTKRDDAFKKIESIKSKFFTATKETINQAAIETSDILLWVRKILLELDKKYTEKKNDRGVLDFSDLESKAFQLLLTKNKFGEYEKTEIAKSISQEIREIYIDEYQDINFIQDMIFKSISKENGAGEENRFMVGDIKQSIYRFRGARPDIFNEYKNSFFDLTHTDKKQKKIFLSNNFRCSKSVIDFTNFVFKKIMPENYSPEDFLIYSRLEEKKVTAPCELLIGEPINSNETEELETTKTEAEADLIAKKIQQIVNNETYLNKDGKTFDFSDITILLRTMKGTSDIYEKVLKINGIPVKSELPESFFDKREIILILSLLNAIDNCERDIFLASVMRSILYHFTDDELCEIRIQNKNQTFYKSLCEFIKSSENTLLVTKLNFFLNDLDEFISLSRQLSCDKLLWHIYGKTNLLALCSSRAFGKNTPLESKNAYNNLICFYNIARNYADNSFKGLFAFLDYINDLIKEGATFNAGQSESENKVKIMSTHHSKGLEFSVCIIADLSKSFNTEDEKKILVTDDNLGIGIKLRDSANSKIIDTKSGFVSIDTPFRQAIIAKDNEALREEEKRILYVAQTRAKDLLILSIFSKKLKTLAENASVSHTENMVSRNAKSPAEWILNSLGNQKILTDFYDILGIDFKPNDREIDEKTIKIQYQNSNFSLNQVLFPSQNNEINENPVENSEKINEFLRQIENRFSYSYDNKILSKIPAKLTVSRLKDGLLDDNNTEVVCELKSTPEFLKSFKQATGAEKGTALHLFMQFANYENAENNSANIEAKRLLEKGFIDKETFKLLDFSKLDGFFKTNLYFRMKNSKNLKREMRFNLKIPADTIINSTNFEYVVHNDEFVLVQGVIDCFFENSDQTITVVDFKTDNVFGEEAKKILIKRHSEQLLYYCKAVEDITQKKVSTASLFSFSLMEEIEI